MAGAAHRRNRCGSWLPAAQLTCEREWEWGEGGGVLRVQRPSDPTSQAAHGMAKHGKTHSCEMHRVAQVRDPGEPVRVGPAAHPACRSGSGRQRPCRDASSCAAFIQSSPAEHGTSSVKAWVAGCCGVMLGETYACGARGGDGAMRAMPCSAGARWHEAG